MSKNNSVEKFHLTGKGAVCVLNEKSGCWEYELPDKGKIVLWIDPSDESQCVYLCIEVQDVNGKTLSEKENDVFIAHAVMFDPMGLCMLPFRPMKMGSAWQFSYDDWMRMYAPEQTSSFSVMAFFYPNPFGVEYLVIPEQPELFSRFGKQKNSIFLKQKVIEKMNFFKAKFQENDEEIKEKLKERNQMIEEEWKEWEDRVKEDWEREALKKQERQQNKESDEKEESGE